MFFFSYGNPQRTTKTQRKKSCKLFESIFKVKLVLNLSCQWMQIWNLTVKSMLRVTWKLSRWLCTLMSYIISWKNCSNMDICFLLLTILFDCYGRRCYIWLLELIILFFFLEYFVELILNFILHVNMIDEKGKFDELVEDKGVKILIDPKALMHVIGTKMDFVDDKLRYPLFRMLLTYLCLLLLLFPLFGGVGGV